MSVSSRSTSQQAGGPAFVGEISNVVTIYLVSAGLVLIALNLALGQLPAGDRKRSFAASAVELLGRLDGRSYEQILRNGYTYSRERTTTAVFFPGYPFVARALFECGVPAPGALLATNWTALLGVFWVAQRYLRDRFVDDPASAKLALAALALNPMTFYMWFMYSEAAFLFVLVLLLALIHRRAPPILVALVCGALTGIRSAGVAAIPVVLVYAWMYRPAPRSRFKNVTITLCLCAWGLAAFSWSLYRDFGDGLAFIHAQEPYGRAAPWTEKLHSLSTLKPLRRMFDPAESSYWNRTGNASVMLLNNHVGDALFWGLFGLLIAVGGWKRWLNWQELLLSVLLFGFATWFKADHIDMASQGRFMSVIFPVYLVAGRLLAHLNWAQRLAAAALAAALYVNYTVNFAIGNAW